MPNFPIIQGVPIFYNGVVTVVGSSYDPDFEIVTMDQPMLRRNVKVLRKVGERGETCTYDSGNEHMTG